MDKVAVDIAFYFVKIVLIIYILASIWWPMRAVNRALNTMAGKAVLLLGIVVAAMFDVPLAILFTATMIIAVVSEERPATAGAPATKKEAAAPVKPSHPQHPQPQAPAQSEPQPHKHVQYKKPQEKEGENTLAPIDMEILQLAHVSEDRLIRIQTSALDPSLVGYEEDVVATVDMSTVLVERDD